MCQFTSPNMANEELTASQVGSMLISIAHDVLSSRRRGLLRCHLHLTFSKIKHDERY